MPNSIDFYKGTFLHVIRVMRQKKNNFFFSSITNFLYLVFTLHIGSMLTFYLDILPKKHLSDVLDVNKEESYSNEDLTLLQKGVS